MGNRIQWDITRYPHLSSKLFEDIPGNKIKEIYGID